MDLIRRLIVAAFGIIQLILGTRVLLDLGMLPLDMPLVEFIQPASDALAMPVAAAVERFGAQPPDFGMGLNPTIVAAFVGWSIVEVVVLMIVGRAR